ncbi:hypothetical protein [Streptomyces tagetis]|uniref:Uncharacterized protein n=1 Tax=Streptomyces tagetis TaxID=2820809 RepID=A0A940XFB9_9ACTN|nr:hypothetical protein [Streptomyces sp. RG38]MBQ0827385.1 hypothetical protein [Streptomyces sp. RG38]
MMAIKTLAHAVTVAAIIGVSRVPLCVVLKHGGGGSRHLVTSALAELKLTVTKAWLVVFSDYCCGGFIFRNGVGSDDDGLILVDEVTVLISLRTDLSFI